jgi:hypothetical protein
VILEEGHTFLDGFGVEILHQQNPYFACTTIVTFFTFSCERLSLQLSSDTMLRFKLLLRFISFH